MGKTENDKHFGIQRTVPYNEEFHTEYADTPPPFMFTKHWCELFNVKYKTQMILSFSFCISFFFLNEVTKK